MAVQSIKEVGGAIFDPVPSEADPELSEELSVPLGNQQVRPKYLRLPWVLGGLLAGASMLVVASTVRQTTVKAADLLALQDESSTGVKPFKQCGGAKYMGRTCCKTGCACVIQSQYYSVCQAPGGGQTCNVEKAKGEVMSAKEAALEARPAALQAFKAAKKALIQKREAKKNLKAAEALLATKTEMGRKVRAAKMAKERLVDDAKKQAELAEKAAKDKLHHYEHVKKEIADMNKTAALRSHGKCGGLFANCGPLAPPKLTKYMACCEEGCICKWRDAYYAQCQAPGGGGCDAAEEAKHVKERHEVMEKLYKEHVQLELRRKQTKQHAEDVDKEANAIRHKAAEAGTARVNARRIMLRKRAIYRSKTTEARRLKSAALHKKHAVHYAAKAIKAWEQAASGKKCGKEDEEDQVDSLGLEEEEEDE